MAGAIFEAQQIQRIHADPRCKAPAKAATPMVAKLMPKMASRRATGDRCRHGHVRHGHGQNSWEKSWDITDFSDQSTKVSRWENQ
jgi:hypothetical protein